MSLDTQHLHPDEIAAYRDRMLPPGRLLEVDDHLAACARCRALAGANRADEGSRTLAAALADAVAPLEHPAVELLADFVDARLDDVDRGLVEAHLEECPDCAADAEAFRDARAQMTNGGGATQSSARRWPVLAAMTAMAAGAAGLLVWVGGRDAPVPVPGGPDPPSASLPAAESPAPEPVVSLDSRSGRVSLLRDGTLHGLAALTPAERDSVRRALEDGRVALAPEIGALGAAPGTLMGDAGQAAGPRLLAPIATAVESDRPTFTWTVLPGAGTYVVSIYDLEFREIVSSPRVESGSWRPETPLTRGRTYVWQVRAGLGDREVVAPAPPSPEARFRVLDAATAARVGDLRQRAAGSTLALGVLLAEAGVADAAERALEDLAASNPDAPVARRLLESLRNQRASAPHVR